MSLRTFWTIVLKIFGLYILVQILYFVPTFFSEIVVLFSAGGQYGGRGEAWIALSALLLTFSVFLFMLIAFLFRLSLVKVFISFFMITSPRLIVNFIERKRRGKTKIAEAE